MEFVSGAPVYVPARQFVAQNVEIPREAKEYYGANPTYLPAIAEDKKGCYELLWGGSSVESAVAFPRFDEEEGSALVDEISDLKHPDCASILSLIRRKFAHNVYGSTLGNRVYLWVNPLRQKVQNSPLLMSSIYTLCKKYKSASLKSLKAAAAADSDADATQMLHHPYAGMYVRATQVTNDLFRDGVSQTICMRGSHGSGKSYSYRLLLQYLVFINNLRNTSSSASTRRDLTDASFDPSNASDCLSMQASFVEPEELFFQPCLLSQSVIAGLRVQASFGSVAAGSSSEYRLASRSMSSARIVYSKSQRAGKHHIEKVIFATRLLDSARLKPHKRNNMPANTETTRMPYLIMMQFLAHLSGNTAAMEHYKIKPAEYNVFMSDDAVKSFTVGVQDHLNQVNHGTCNCEEERKAFAADFLKLKQSLFAIGMEEAMWEEVCKTLAVICHLQSMNIVGVDSAIISAGSKNYLAAAEDLLGLDNGSLLQLITKKVDKNKFTVVDNRAGEARVVNEVMSGAIYRRLAAFLLSFCSCSGPSKVKSTGLMTINLVDTPTNYGIYDGIGPGNNLETINHNTVPYQSFMDLNAGYLLEWVSAITIEATFNKEINKYQEEEVQLSVGADILPPSGNGRTIYMDLYDARAGIMQILEAACMAPKADDKILTDNIMKIKLSDPNHAQQDNCILSTKIKPGTKLFRANGFIIRHSYGAVHYDGDNFVNLNKSRSLFSGYKSLGVELLEVGNIHILKQSNNYNFNDTLDVLKSADDSNGGVDITSTTTDRDSVGSADKGGYGSAGFKAFGGKTVNPKTFAMRSEYEGTSKAINVLFGSQDPAVAGTKPDHLEPALHYFLCIRPVNATSLAGTPPTSPIEMDSGVVDAQLNALWVPQFSKLLKVKFAEPSRSFQEFYEYYKVALPFHMHSKQSQDAMLDRNANFRCSSTEAVSMVESLCLFRNKTVKVGDLMIDTSKEEYTPVPGKSIIFLPYALHQLLEEFRTKILITYHASCKRIQSWVRMIRHKSTYKMVLKLILKLQSQLRMKLTRRMYQKMFGQCEFIKFKLLMVVHRRRFLEMKSSINHIKRWLGHKLQSIRMLHLLDRLHFFHSLARAALIKKNTMLVMDRVIRLQFLARLFLFRCRYRNKRNFSALQIQRNTRGYLSRKTNSAIVARIKKGILTRKRISSASRLQAYHRGCAVRRRLKKIDDKVRLIQKWAGSRKVRNDYLKIKFLAQWGQKQMRYIIANNRIHRMLEKKMMLEAARQISIAREKELKYTSQYDAQSLCIGTLPHMNGHGVTSIDAFFLDVFSDLSLAYPDGWISTIMKHVERIYMEHSSKKSIAQIAIGSHHTVIVDDRSNVYTFGLGDGGQLGHGKRTSLRAPKCLDRLQTLISGAERGDVRKSEPRGMRTSSSIHRNTLGANTITVQEVCCGREHTMLLTGGGRVWSWGANKFGQLGHSNFEVCTCPRQVVVNSQFNLEGGSMSSVASQSFRKIKQIAAGGYHSVALTEAGVLYTWGSAAALGRSQGQSASTISRNHGYNTRSAYEAAKKAARESKKELPKHDCEPGQPPFFTSNVRIPLAQVVCGDAHTVVKCTATVRNLRTGVELYAWGNNSYGQLGIGKKDKEVPTPTRVDLPATEKVFIGFKSEATEKKVIEHGSTSSAPAYGVAAKAGKKPVKKEVEVDKDGTITRLLYSENDMANACLCSGGRHMLLALKGDVWAWGWNMYGQIGDGKPPKNADANTDAGEVSGESKSENKPSGGSQSNLYGDFVDVPTGEDVYSPKLVLRHGQKIGTSSFLGYVKTVTAGWRHSTACTYFSHSISNISQQNAAYSAAGGAGSGASRSPIGNSVYMWGAVPRSSSLLRNDGARLEDPSDEVISASPIAMAGSPKGLSEKTQKEEKGEKGEEGEEGEEGEGNSRISPKEHSVAHIRQSKNFVEQWGNAANRDTFSSDDESQKGEETSQADNTDAHGSSSVSTRSPARTKSKLSAFEDDPTPYPCQVLMPADIGPVNKLLCCGSTTFSLGMIATTSHELTAVRAKRGEGTSGSSPKSSSQKSRSASVSTAAAASSSAVSPTALSLDKPRTMPPHIYGTGIHSPEKRSSQPLPPWHRDAGLLKEINFHVHQGAISEELRPMKNFTLPIGNRALKASNMPASGSVSARSDDERSDKSFNTGLTTESGSSARRVVAAATKKRDRKEALIKARRAEIRSREQRIDKTALLSLFDPFVAKAVEAEAEAETAKHTSKDRRKSTNKTVLFATTEQSAVETPDLNVGSTVEYISQADTEDSSVRQLQYDVSMMSERFIAEEVSRTGARRVSVVATGAALRGEDADRGNLAGKKMRSKSIKLSQPTTAVALESLTSASATERYSDAAFDYSTKHTSPKANPRQRDSSPLRLAAVRDLAGMIEKIRVTEDGK